MRKIKEILRLKWHLGHTHREIATSVKVSASTVSDCARRAAEKGLTWPLDESLDEDALHLLLYGKPAGSQVDHKQFDWPYVRKELSRKGVTLQLLWYEYKQHYPTGVSYSRYCRLYRRWRNKLDVCLRQTYKGGEKLFVDYSGLTVPIIINDKTGETRQAEIFVGVLGASNRIYVEASPSQSLPDWLNAHVRMFNDIGGVPEIVVPDNLKAGVKSPHLYEPDINPSYLELAEHYGVAVIPARVSRPQDKAKVEQAVQHVERRILAPLRNRQFFSVHALNQAIKPLLDAVNAAPFQKLPGSRDSEFEALDKPNLKPLPIQPYQFSNWKKAKVNIDYHVELDRHCYSVPYRYVRVTTDVRYTDTSVEIFLKGKRIATHRRSHCKGRHTTIADHMPASHRAYLQWDAPRIIRWAKKQGDGVATMVDAIIKSCRHPQQGFRSCLGLIRLGKTYGEQRLEAACQRALTIGTHSYKSVQSILKHNLDQQPPQEPAPEKLSYAHEYVRGADYFK